MTELKTTKEVCGMGHSMKRKEDARFLRGQGKYTDCLLYTSPSPRDGLLSRMPSSA